MNEQSVFDEWANKDWSKARGIETTDYNNHLVLVRASVEGVAQSLSKDYPEAQWSRDVLGHDILLGQEGLFVFRLTGHSWTEVLHHQHTRQSVLDPDYIECLSRGLKARVISYFVGDTAGVIGYTLYDRSEILENFGGSDAEVEFTSQVRKLTADIDDVWEFTHQFFVEQDASEPGLQPGYFVTDYYATLPPMCPGKRVKIHNPGFILVDTGGEEIISRPGLDRVDYIALSS